VYNKGYSFIEISDANSLAIYNPIVDQIALHWLAYLSRLYYCVFCRHCV